MQVAFDATTLTYGPATTSGAFFHWGSAVTLVVGAIALWRPSFTLPLLFHYVMFRHQLGIVTGVEISETDYLSMLDVGEFATVGALVVALTARQPWAERFKVSAASLIWACAVGAHLGNYLVSGWTKIKTGGDDPFFWLMHNPVQTSILIGLERGDNPLGAWPALVQASWDGIVGTGVAFNLFVLGTQLFVPLSIVHRRALMVFTLLFDLFHIGVYLTLGAFFFFWIAVNLLIYAGAKTFDDKAFTPAMRIVMAAAMVFGHFTFYTSHLGWLDAAKLASPNFYAETRDGQRVKVPSVYFGIMSYTIAQTAMYIPDDHFPMRLGGNTYNRADWADGQTCGPQALAHQDTGVTLPTVEAMVQQTDAAMRAHPLVKRDNLYYFYPHHMVANPLVFGAFNRLSMGDIVRYHYVVDSVCLSLKDGVLVRNVRRTTDVPIDVAR